MLVPKRIDPTVIRELYVEKGLSASQIAQQIGASKQMVLARLRRAGVHRTERKGRARDSYRYPNPAYGLRVIGGQLVPNPAEMKVVRKIVTARDRDGWTWKAIAEHLNAAGLKSRTGVAWDLVRVHRVYRRWAGKV